MAGARLLSTLIAVGALLALAAPASAERKGTVRWHLSTDRDTITTETRTVRINVTYGACTGKPGTPRVKRRSLSVVVTVPMPEVEPPPPGVGCPDIAYNKTFTVRLRGPLGRRALRDGSSMPPRFVARARG